MLEVNQIHNMDCLQGLKLLDDNSINCYVTSPPYWGLRDYGVPGQLGLESTPEEYVQKMVEVFREVKRALRDNGTLWLNLGDSYYRRPQNETNPEKNAGFSANRGAATARNSRSIPKGCKEKDLVGIPWMVAFALRADGWYLRSDIIWHKPNPMPESVTDRPTKTHEYIFLLSKSAKYYYDQDAILEPVSANTHLRLSQDLANQIGSHRANGGAKTNGPMKAVSRKTKQGIAGVVKNNSSFDQSVCLPVTERNKRTVWTVTTQSFSQAHFATFPPKLIEPCILAGCPKDGIVLDPFMGSGTTGMVAKANQRNYIGFELNPEYIEIAEKHRTSNVQMKII
jgi:DNA modification methylase